MISLSVNGEVRDLEVDPATPLLWVLRDTLGLTGTKYSCGIALCGACMVHVDGAPVRACVTPLSAV
ncbi:MAG: 2Fe-2S iron-sulfur cluster-binding protein, partial [Pseudomonadota bacterium]